MIILKSSGYSPVPYSDLEWCALIGLVHFGPTLFYAKDRLKNSHRSLSETSGFPVKTKPYCIVLGIDVALDVAWCLWVSQKSEP